MIQYELIRIIKQIFEYLWISGIYPTDHGMPLELT